MAKKKVAKKPGGDPLVVKSKVKEYLKSKGDLNVGQEVYETLSGHLEGLLTRATERASENGRKTIQAKDI